MVKCILKGMSSSDPYSGEMARFETLYSGIPEACSMWASGCKNCVLEDVSLFYEDGTEVPSKITDKYCDRYYYGRYIFDQNGEEIGKKNWKFLHIELYFPKTPTMPTEVCPRKTGILIKK